MPSTQQHTNAFLDESAYKHDLLFAITDNAADGVLVFDTHHKILLANKAACVLFGYFPTELVDQDIAKVLPEDLLGNLEENVRKYSYAGKQRMTGGSAIEGWATARDGVTIPLEVSIGSVELAGSERIFIANLRDITDRIKATEKMRQQAQIIDQIRDGILVTNFDRKIIKCNHVLADILAMRNAEIIGRDIYTLVDYEFPEGVTRETMRAEVLEKGFWTGAVRIVNAQQKTRWIDTSVSMQRSDDGKFDGFISVWRDITSRREAEIASARSERIESLGRIAGGVAHDINNLLFPMFLSLDCAIEDLKLIEQTTTTRDIGDNLDDAMTVGVNIKEVVQNIMVFSHDSSSEAVENDTAVLFGEIWRIAKLCVPSSVTTQVDFTSESKRIYASASTMSQLLVNIVSNAVDACDSASGKLTVSTRIVNGQDMEKPRLFALRSERYIRLTVQDNGSGIEEQLIDKIFEPFYTTKDVGEGSGIGMSQVSQIIQNADGAIDVRSEVGKGTAFHVYLPVI